MIAANQQGNQRRLAAFHGFHQQCLDGFLDWQIELLDQLGNGFRVWRINQRHFLSGGSTRLFWRHGFCKLDVGSVVGRIREDHIIFTALCQHLEFVRGATADRTGVSLYGTEIQTHTAEDLAVGRIHRVVSFLQ